MEKTIDFAELEELKTQFNLLNEKLEKQKIINENLIKESMKKKISYVERFHKMYFIVATLIFPLFIAILLLYKASLAIIAFAFASIVVEIILHYKAFRTLRPKELLDMKLVDAMERVSRFKKQYKIATWIMLIPSLLIFVMFIGLVTNYSFDMGHVIFYGLFCLAAMIWELTRTRKLFSRLDGVLKQIKELKGE